MYHWRNNPHARIDHLPATSAHDGRSDDSCLAGYEKRADSTRTALAYELILNDFRHTLQSAGLDLDSEPALVAPLAQGWARASKREGMTVTATTFKQRRSIISSL
jgi:hypothetical protein